MPKAKRSSHNTLHVRNKADVVPQPEITKASRVAIVVFEKVVRISLSGCAASAEVNDHPNVGKMAVVNLREKCLGRKNILVLQIAQVPPFLVAAKCVHENQIAIALSIEFADRIAPDKPCRTCNNDWLSHSSVSHLRRPEESAQWYL